jgi:hypothetical protein
VRAFEASTTIRAPADRVWDVLTDAAGYPTWDSGVTKVDGRIADGERVVVHSEVNPGRAFPVTVELDPPRGMTWRGGMPLGLFTGTRSFRLTPTDDGALRFTMREEYTGPLAPMIFRSIPDLGPSFTRFVNGLKARAEAA